MELETNNLIDAMAETFQHNMVVLGGEEAANHTWRELVEFGFTPEESRNIVRLLAYRTKFELAA